MSRRLDLSKFRGGSDSEEEEGAFAPPRKPPVLLDALKQQTFSHGVRKKTKKEIEKENEERKRVEEEKFVNRHSFINTLASCLLTHGIRSFLICKRAAAIAFAEFEEAFNGDGAETAPRGGTSSGRSGNGYPPRGPQSSRAGGFVRAGADGSGPSAYQPPTRQIPTGPSRRGMTSNFRSPSPEPLKPKPKGKRAMDSFLEEIKRGISEESLGMFFAKLGPIGAVKIMWPRGDEDTSIGANITTSRRAKAGLSGFVAYMKRKDAEAAVKDLDGFDWGGCILRVGWSKMIRLPIRPIYDQDHLAGIDDLVPALWIGHRHDNHNLNIVRAATTRGLQSQGELIRVRMQEIMGIRTDAVAAVRVARLKTRGRHLRDLDHLPKIGPEKEQFITAVAQKVKSHGTKFEEVLRDRESQNPKFEFLRNMDGRAELYSSDSAEDSEKERARKGTLGKIARKRFESGLRAMTGNREEIARLMEFAMVHADAAEEVRQGVPYNLLRTLRH
ncbi:hypothetical protein QFC22_001009 [Naganishia vaughanmartiniae]|uniref:Uncharacterized protein n=1 Tax=Naganishia vaughanmartiniae TaxID=1424756 RepID=A0ACC2XMG6_9TREE|nr:hypothetical protein QFC22_001009 [Naganishia vaughanmartiniae]